MVGKVISAATLCGALLLGMSAFSIRPATAQEHEHPGPMLSEPADGATVSNSVTVALGFGGGPGGPGGPGRDNDHGDRPPPPPPSDMDGQEPPDHHGPRRHLYLFIDAPPPETGTVVQEDSTHLAWPPGQRQLVLTLPAGPHQLQLVFADQDGKIGRRHQNALHIQVQ